MASFTTHHLVTLLLSISACAIANPLETTTTAGSLTSSTAPSPPPPAPSTVPVASQNGTSPGTNSTLAPGTCTCAPLPSTCANPFLPPKDSVPFALNATKTFNPPNLNSTKTPPEEKSWRVPRTGQKLLNRAWCPTFAGDEQECMTGKLANEMLEEYDVISVDLFDYSKEDIMKLTSKNKAVICYLSVGTIEDWREDVQADPQAWAEAAGNPMGSWEGETWLDVRRLEVLLPLMASRIRLAREKGCDGIEPDNTDCWLADRVRNATCGGSFSQACASGIVPYNVSDPTTHEFRTANLAYLTWLADYAHKQNLSIGLKNTFFLSEELEPWYDFAVAEGSYNALAYFNRFVEHGKPVFIHDYTVTPQRFRNDSLIVGLSDQEFCSRVANGTEWQWADDSGKNFCSLCSQASTLGYGPVYTPRAWNSSAWVTCADYVEVCRAMGYVVVP